MKNKLVFASALFAATIALVTPASAQQKTENKTEAKGVNVTTVNWDSQSETTVSYVEDGRSYKIKLNGSKIAEMTIDGKEVPKEEFPKYDALVKTILAQIEKDREQAERDRAQAVKDRMQAEKDRLQADRDRQQAEKDREQARKDREQAERDRKNADSDRGQREKDRLQADADRKQAEKDRQQAERDREQAQKDRAQAEKDREQAAKDRKQAEEDRKLMNAITEELIKDKLIESRDMLGYLQLDGENLIVNGKEQPKDVHSRYKQKFLKGEKSQFRYSNSGGNRNLSFD